jgi:uncharacterized protein YceK
MSIVVLIRKILGQNFQTTSLLGGFPKTIIMYYWINVLIIVGTLLMSGCSTHLSRAAEIEKIANAQLAIVKAQDTNAQEFAPQELQEAQQKLQKAKQALQTKNSDKAVRLAEQALIDAKLAEAKAESEMARQALNKLRDRLDEKQGSP